LGSGLVGSAGSGLACERRGAMGKKKGGATITQQSNRPFCYFCDRTFNDESVLIQHQRAKHFRCQECDNDAIRGKCESVQGLIVHTLKIHAKSLAKVPNALPGRSSPGLNVYGMDGIPAEFLSERGIEQHVPIGKAEPPPPAPPEPVAIGFPAMPGMPPMPDMSVGPAPSLEGFQQFLAAQKLPPPPGMDFSMPPPVPLPGAPEAFNAGGFLPQAGQPSVMPPVPLQQAPAAGAIPAAALDSGGVAEPATKRPRVEEGGEDVSVEENRALLDRYRALR